ncbi:MAG: sugar kinase [Henriciella sp.]|uniref:sugar kinase n=1 Tax=Henriciella sp. TaxID=1968823 RepID=UPI003C77A618
MAGRIICFGELLLRFTAPGHERLMQSPKFDVHFGGAEANVGVSLARFGHAVSMVSALPNNPFGHSMRSALKAQGVSTDNVLSGDGRMGLYFLETGAVRRPSRIVYDRANSVFAGMRADAYDWSCLLKGADWLHVSGITPAVGPAPSKAVLGAVSEARSQGVNVAFDGNYREALWKAWGGDGPSVLKDILAHATVAFINERDIALLLGIDIEPRADAISRAFETFPGLKTVAATTREQDSVSNQTLTGELYAREGHWTSRPHDMANVVDRIGGGDAFAAGVLHGLIEGFDPQRTIEFATAASAIKHSIPGDWNLTSLDEVEEAINENGLDVRR